MFGRRNGSQPGFTLVELVIAVAIGAIVLAGGVAILRAMLISTSDSTDKELAMLEVQYVNFWIGEDVVQGQNITLGNSSNGGFPLVIDWASGTPVLQSTTVNYNVETMTDSNLWKLYRTKNSEKLMVAEYLDPSLTRCYQKQLGNGTYVNVLVLEVTSEVNRKSASGSYEISPRYGNTTWSVTP